MIGGCGTRTWNASWENGREREYITRYAVKFKIIRLIRDAYIRKLSAYFKTASAAHKEIEVKLGQIKN